MSERRTFEDLPIEQLVDEMWPAHQPPPDFASRVLAAQKARGAAAAGPRRRRRWPLVLSLGGVAAAVAVLVVTMVRAREGAAPVPAPDGHLAADERQTVHLQDRALAVAEKDSEITWKPAGQGLRVDQRRGDVFYRVDKGTPFVVVTAAGEVEVTGTCFRVVVDQAGSESVAARMRVEVLEGSVRARSGSGEVTLKAGEQARLAPDQLPLRSDRDGAWPAAEASRSASPSELRAWERASRLRALDAEARIRQLERALAQQQAPASGGEALDVGKPTPRRKLVALTAEERGILARRCEFRWGLPRHLTQWANPNFDRKLLIDEAEHAAIVRVMEEQRIEFMEQLRSIYLEVVGDQQTVQTLSPMGLHHEIDSKSRSADGREARQTILMEWAGRRKPPADVSKRPAIERFWRLVVSATDDFVARLQPILGPGRARELAVSLVDFGVYGSEPRCPSAEKNAP